MYWCYEKKFYQRTWLMTKKDNEDCENSSKCWICGNDYVDGQYKVKYYFLCT